MPAFETRDANQWQRWMADFDRVSREFAAQFAALQQLGPFVRERHPELQSQYSQLVARGANHQATLATLSRLRNDAQNWLASIGIGTRSDTGSIIGAAVGGSSAAGGGIKTVTPKSGLGAIPVIVAIVGIVAAAAALVVIANWIKESFDFTQRLNALFRLEEQGHSAQEAANIVRSVSTAGGAGLTSLVSNPFSWLMIGAAVLLLAPSIMRALEQRKA